MFFAVFNVVCATGLGVAKSTPQLGRKFSHQLALLAHPLSPLTTQLRSYSKDTSAHPLAPARFKVLRASHGEGQDLEEMFDIFQPPSSRKSTELKKIGQKKRSSVHRDGDWHRSVHIWLYNSAGEMMLQRRSKFKDTHPNMWDVSSAGHITSGDESRETAVKEFHEELGVLLPQAKFEFLYTLAASAKGETAMHGPFLCNEYQDIYLVRYPFRDENGKLIFPGGETNGMGGGNGTDGNRDNNGAISLGEKVPPMEEMVENYVGKGEVSGVKSIHYEKLAALLLNKDPSYVPRTEEYVKPLMSAIKLRIS